MHSSYTRLSKLVVLVCVVMICASLASARNKRPTSRSSSRKAAVTSTVRSSSRHGVKRKATSTSRKSRKAETRRVSRPRGQQAIESDRVREIQEALIRANYMDGEPTGEWDDSTRRALTRFQADNGWQSKVVPDSRALIKLGLGPNHENVINRETSLISRPQGTGTDSVRTLEPGGGTPRR